MVKYKICKTPNTLPSTKDASCYFKLSIPAKFGLGQSLSYEDGGFLME